MNAVVICPADRSEVAFLAHLCPLALVPFLGRSLLDLWLAELATRGARQVTILAADRPDLIRTAVRRGEAWGLQIEVRPEQSESSPDTARHLLPPDSTHLPQPWDVVTLDRLPSGGPPLWSGCAQWLAAVRALAPQATQDRVGMRDLSPGIAIHVRSRISPTARLEAPCWIGANAWIGPRTRIGPDTIIEESAYVDEGAEVANSLVGPATYVGALTEVRDSIAWGRNLFRWTTGSHAEIVDDFLLSDLGGRVRNARATSPAGRVAALAALLLTSPILALAWLRRQPGSPLFDRRLSVRTPESSLQFVNTCVHYRLPSLPDPWQRWPELWNILRGEFGWVGNRPLTPDQAASLSNEFERLWLAVPTGLFSLADAERCASPFDDESRAHASFYAVSRSWRTDFSILRRILAHALRL